MKNRFAISVLAVFGLLLGSTMTSWAQNPVRNLKLALGSADAIAPGLIWGGLTPSGIPVLIQFHGHSWLWGHPRAPEGFVPQGGRLYARDKMVLGESGLSTMGGERLPVLYLQEEDLEDLELPRRIQRARFETVLESCDRTPALRVESAFAWPRGDAELFRLQMETDLCLRRAVESTDPHNRRQWAWRALEADRTRQSKLPLEVADWELASLVRASLGAWAAAPGGNPAKPWLPEWGVGPDRPQERLQVMANTLVWLLQQEQPGCPGPCDTWWGGPQALDPRTQLLACLPGEQPPVRRLSPLDRLNIDNGVEQQLRAMHASDRVAQTDFSSQPGWSLVIQCSPDDPLWLLFQDPSRTRNLGKAGMLYQSQLSASNQSTTIDVVDRDCLVRSFSPPGGRDLARLEIAGIDPEPLVVEQGDRLVISADGLQADFTQASFTEQGRVLLVNLPPALRP